MSNEREAAMSRARGAAIRRIRKRRDITQVELAQMARIDPATVSRLERGQIPHVAHAIMERIAAALEVSVEALDEDVPRNPATAARRIAELMLRMRPDAESWQQLYRVAGALWWEVDSGRRPEPLDHGGNDAAPGDGAQPDNDEQNPPTHP